MAIFTIQLQRRTGESMNLENYRFFLFLLLWNWQWMTTLKYLFSLIKWFYITNRFKILMLRIQPVGTSDTKRRLKTPYHYTRISARILDPQKYCITVRKGLVLSCAWQLRPFLYDPKVKNWFTLMLYVRQKLLMHKRILKYCCCCL